MNGLKIIYARHNRTRSVQEIPEGFIRYYDLTAVLSGEIEYTVNEKSYRLSGGDIVFFRPGDKRGRGTGDNPCEYVSLNFTCSSGVSLPSVMRGALSSELLMQIALFDELVQKFYPDAEAMLSPLAECFITTLSRNLETQNLPPLVQKIISYIHGNLSSRITLADVGASTFFSPIYCDTVFKASMGRSIVDYVIEKRIEEAKKLIIHDTIPLGLIAERVGFSDYNYFARTFKKRSGYTPLEYKKMFSGSPPHPVGGRMSEG